MEQIQDHETGRVVSRQASQVDFFLFWTRWCSLSDQGSHFYIFIEPTRRSKDFRQIVLLFNLSPARVYKKRAQLALQMSTKCKQRNVHKNN